MSTNKIITLTIVGIVLILSFVFVGVYYSYNNKEISLRKQSEAQLGKIEAVRDNMFKILQDQAHVTTQYKESFDKIYTNIIQGRYEQGDGSLMKFIKESNPNFDSNIYRDLIKSIEIERTGFTREQERMLDIIREHETLCNKPIVSAFISNRTPIVYTVISSTNTKEIMQTGVDNEQLEF